MLELGLRTQAVLWLRKAYGDQKGNVSSAGVLLNLRALELLVICEMRVKDKADGGALTNDLFITTRNSPIERFVVILSLTACICFVSCMQ